MGMSLTLLPTLQVIMLTGDNPLTACHVAKELKISQRKLLVLTRTEEEWAWQNRSGTTTITMETKPSELGKEYDLCITGEVRRGRGRLSSLIPRLRYMERPGNEASPRLFLHIIRAVMEDLVYRLVLPSVFVGSGVSLEKRQGRGIFCSTALCEDLCQSLTQAKGIL